MGIINLGPDSGGGGGYIIESIPAGTALPVGGMYFGTTQNYISQTYYTSTVYTQPIVENNNPDRYLAFFLRFSGLLVWGDTNPSTQTAFDIDWDLIAPVFFPAFPTNLYNFLIQDIVVPQVPGEMTARFTRGMLLAPSTNANSSAAVLPASDDVSAFNFDPFAGHIIVCAGCFSVTINKI